MCFSVTLIFPSLEVWHGKKTKNMQIRFSQVHERLNMCMKWTTYQQQKKTNDSGGESNLLQICPRHLLHFPHPFWAIKVVVIAKRQFQWFMIHDWLLWLLTIDDISNDGWWFSCFFLTTDFCSDLMDWPNSGSLWGTLALWRQDTLAGGRWTWRPANYMPHAVLDRTNHIERSSVFGVPHYL